MEMTQELSRLKLQGAKFSMTSDEWTSVRNRKYINVNLHSTGGKCWNLGLIRAEGSLPAEVILENLKTKLMEFQLDLAADMISITTDGAKVMEKLGRLVKWEHQLCLAHGIQLAVLDTFYQKSCETRETNDLEENDDSEDSEAGNEFSMEVNEESNEFSHKTLGPVIEKVRKVVRKCKRSPKLNDLLQKYVRQDLGFEFTLKLDSKTRWSSLLTMLESILKLKSALQKVWIDTPLSDWDDTLSEEDFSAVKMLVKALTPIKNTVEAICKEDATLLTADAAINFMLKILESQDSQITADLLSFLKVRLQYRRTANSSVLQYLHTGNLDYNSMCKTFGAFFMQPRQSDIIEVVKKFNHPHGHDDSVSEDSNNFSPSEFDVNKDLKTQLYEAIETANKGAHGPGNTRNDPRSMTGIIKKEISLWETTGSRGVWLKNAYDALLSIQPTSVEAERAFSAAGYLCSKIRSRMGDKTLDTLCFLRYYFRK